MTVSFKPVLWAALTLACSTTANENAPASSDVATGGPNLQALGRGPTEGGSVGQAEPKLSDEELRRLLDALEQEIGVHVLRAR
jgi:hypothetical protein